MSGPTISDHALLRFLDRAGGLEVEALRARLSASLARAHQAARSVSQGDYLVQADGLSFVVRGAVVTTVVPVESPARSFRALAGDKSAPPPAGQAPYRGADLD